MFSHGKDIKLFTGNANPALATEICKILGTKLGEAEVKSFADGWDEQSQSFVGRSYAESPDIDGRIYFSAERDVQPGEFVPVRITGAMDGELTGELAEEE